jgi:hypothetical protein
MLVNLLTRLIKYLEFASTPLTVKNSIQIGYFICMNDCSKAIFISIDKLAESLIREIPTTIVVICVQTN